MSPTAADSGTDARRYAGGIDAAAAARESGVAITSESNRPKAFSSAARPMGSGASQASTAAVATFLAPSRWKLLSTTARSMGAGGELWKKPSGSSPSETTSGACRGSGFDPEVKALSAHGVSRRPFPETNSGGFVKLLATASKAARSSGVPGTMNQTLKPTTADTSSAQSRRWTGALTGSGGSPRGSVPAGRPAACRRSPRRAGGRPSRCAGDTTRHRGFSRCYRRHRALA